MLQFLIGSRSGYEKTLPVSKDKKLISLTPAYKHIQ